MAAFVGRAHELERLGRLLDDAAAGRGRAVFITGEAGAGKSSLVSRFFVEAALRQPDLRIVGAACSEQFGAGEPYQPFVEAFRDLVGVAEPEGTRWSRLRDLAAELAPHWISAIPLAGNLIAATVTTAVELKRLGTATAAPSEEALFFQYTELLLAAAAEHPILLFIDDLHWADRASIALLSHIGRRIGGERVLLIGTYRAADVDVARHPVRDARIELQRYGVAEELVLGGLDRAAFRALLEEELGAPPAADLEDWLTAQAGANPLFFTELLRWLVEQGHVRERGGGWILERIPESVEIPASADAAIERRLSRLEAEPYRILEYASVAGVEFDSVLLSRLLDMDELALEDALDPLARLHRLVERTGERELPSGELTTVYRFGHSLIRAVLQRGLQGKRRVLLHRRMAALLEDVYAADTDAVAHRLGVHFDEGRQPDRAFHFAILGADRASRVYAHADAIDLLARALRNARTPVERLEALERQGDACRVIGRLADAVAAYTEALDVARAESLASRARGLRRRLLIARSDQGMSVETVASEIDTLMAEARAVGDTAELCGYLRMRSVLPGLPADEALRSCAEAVALAGTTGDARLRAESLFALGRGRALFGEPDDALPPLAAALEYWDAEDPLRAAMTRNILGIAHVRRGDYTAARAAFEEAARTFDTLGDPVSEGGALNNLAVLLVRLGAWDAAETALTESLRLAHRLDAARRTLEPLQNLATLEEQRSGAQATAERWAALVEQARRLHHASSEVIGRAGLARAHARAGRAEEAAAELAAAAGLLLSGDVASEAALAWHLTAARLAADAGDVDEALRLLDRVDRALEVGDRHEWAELRVLRGEIVAARDPGAARTGLAEAIDVLAPLGAAPLLERARAVLASLDGG